MEQMPRLKGIIGVGFAFACVWHLVGPQGSSRGSDFSANTVPERTSLCCSGSDLTSSSPTAAPRNEDSHDLDEDLSDLRTRMLNGITSDEFFARVSQLHHFVLNSSQGRTQIDKLAGYLLRKDCPHAVAVMIAMMIGSSSVHGKHSLAHAFDSLDESLLSATADGLALKLFPATTTTAELMGFWQGVALHCGNSFVPGYLEEYLSKTFHISLEQYHVSKWGPDIPYWLFSNRIGFIIEVSHRAQLLKALERRPSLELARLVHTLIPPDDVDRQRLAKGLLGTTDIDLNLKVLVVRWIAPGADGEADLLWAFRMAQEHRLKQEIIDELWRLPSGKPRIESLILNELGKCHESDPCIEGYMRLLSNSRIGFEYLTSLYSPARPDSYRMAILRSVQGNPSDRIEACHRLGILRKAIADASPEIREEAARLLAFSTSREDREPLLFEVLPNEVNLAVREYMLAGLREISPR